MNLIKTRVVIMLAIVLMQLYGYAQKLPDALFHFKEVRAPSITVEANDHSLLIKSSDSKGFSQCKPYIAWRNVGDVRWTEDYCHSIEEKKITNDQQVLTCKTGPVIAEITIKRIKPNVLEFSGSIKNKSRSIIELARFHYLQGVCDGKTSFLTYPIFSVTKSTDSIPPFRQSFEKMWGKWNVKMLTMAEPVYDAPNWAKSTDAGMFAVGPNLPGWFIGFTAPAKAYGEVGYKTQQIPSPFYVGTVLDNIILEPDSTRELEKFILYKGDCQDGLDYWIKRTATELHAKAETQPLTGYCSWYQKYENVGSDDILKASEMFKSFPSSPGGRTIQIDDGYQVMPGDWRPNKKFEKVWKELPILIEKSGSIPGLWIAPTGIHESHPLVKKHPEMLQHLPDGEMAVSFSNWGWATDPDGLHKEDPAQTYWLEMDRPDSKEFIREIFKNAIKEGWRYFKVDFTYAISTSRVAFNRKKTRMETYKDLYKLIRETCGPDILLNACVGYPERYAIGNVNMVRIGGDIGSEWGSVQQNLRELLWRSRVNGTWYQADPDVFFMRKENSKLNEEENFLLTGSVGLMGGVFMTSDLPDQWTPRGLEQIKAFWTPRIPVRHFVLYGENNSIRAYMVSFKDEKGPSHRVGIYNWSDVGKTISIPMSELNFKKGIKWNATPFLNTQSIKLQGNSIVVENMPPHSLRIVDLIAM